MVQTVQTFKSHSSALVFAFRYSGQAYDRPLMNRLGDDPVRGAKEHAQLWGLDGAGQAAMIWNQVLRLPEMHQYVLYAAYGPRVTACGCGRPCCQGWAKNPFWEACIVKIEEAALIKALAGCVSHRTLRRGVVKSLFGDKSIVLTDLARRCDVAKNTAIDHRQRVRDWLLGTRDGSMLGVKPVAENRIANILEEIGIVEGCA